MFNRCDACWTCTARYYLIFGSVSIKTCSPGDNPHIRRLSYPPEFRKRRRRPRDKHFEPGPVCLQGYGFASRTHSRTLPSTFCYHCQNFKLRRRYSIQREKETRTSCPSFCIRFPRHRISKTTEMCQLRPSLDRSEKCGTENGTYPVLRQKEWFDGRYSENCHPKGSR